MRWPLRDNDGDGDGWPEVGLASAGGLLGGLVGGLIVVAVTLVLKAGIDFAARQDVWYVVLVPLLGLAVAVLVLHGIGRRAAAAPAVDGPRPPQAWRTFHPDAAHADISSDVVDTAGQEERFPWRLAPLRTLAIIATVASGGAMGTEAPAAYLGVAAGAWLGDRGRWWRRLLRPAALGGGAAGVAALMGIPLVGTAFMLELGRRRGAPLSPARVAAALAGGFVGWAINATFGLDLIRLVVPKEPPGSFAQAAIPALFIGVASGVISSLAGLAVYRAKKWRAPPLVRLAVDGAAARAYRVAAGGRRPRRRRHPVVRDRHRAAPDPAGRLPPARGRDDRRGRRRRLRRRLRSVPRRR